MILPGKAWQRDASPPAGRGERGRTALVIAGLVALALVTAGIAGTRVMSERGGIMGAGVVPRYPDKWDPRVVDLVAFTERARGLTFKHPVFIDFLDDAAFRKEMTDVDPLDEKEQADLKSAQAVLRAVGLLSGDVDLLAASNSLAGEGIAGVYDTAVERILVRGTSLDDELRSTLVHELSHALQDQHFNLGRYNYQEQTSGEAIALTALVEADASHVEDAWLQALPAAAREALRTEEETGDAPDFQGVPEVFKELSAFPYEFGPDFLQAIVDQEGDAGRNRLFTEPPTTEEHILLPETYLSRQKPQQVKVPGLGDGEKVVEDTEGDVGMLSLLVILAERIDFGVAWPAVQGWAGDSIVAFDRAGTICVRAEVTFDEPAQAQRFGNAFTQWSKGRPATHTRNDRAVLFESCDPGIATVGRREGHVSGIQGLALRKAIIEVVQEQGAPPETAVCVVDGLIERLGADRLAQIDAAATANPRDPALLELQRTATRLARRCE